MLIKPNYLVNNTLTSESEETKTISSQVYIELTRFNAANGNTRKIKIIAVELFLK